MPISDAAFDEVAPRYPGGASKAGGRSAAGSRPLLAPCIGDDRPNATATAIGPRHYTRSRSRRLHPACNARNVFPAPVGESTRYAMVSADIVLVARADTASIAMLHRHSA